MSSEPNNIGQLTPKKVELIKREVGELFYRLIEDILLRDTCPRCGIDRRDYSTNWDNSDDCFHDFPYCKDDNCRYSPGVNHLIDSCANFDFSQ